MGLNQRKNDSKTINLPTYIVWYEDAVVAFDLRERDKESHKERLYVYIVLT